MSSNMFFFSMPSNHGSYGTASYVYFDHRVHFMCILIIVYYVYRVQCVFLIIVLSRHILCLLAGARVAAAVHREECGGGGTPHAHG